MKKFLAFIAPVVLLLPLVAMAQPQPPTPPTTTTPNLSWFSGLVTNTGTIVDNLIPLFIGLALAAFLFGLARYIFSAGDENAKTNGRKIMISGIIALFVAVSIWGIIAVLGGAFGIGQGGSIPTPSIEGGTTSLTPSPEPTVVPNAE